MSHLVLKEETTIRFSTTTKSYESSRTYVGIKLMGANDSVAPDLIIYTAVRTEVMAGDLAGVQNIVEHHLLCTPLDARRSFQLLMFHIQDYDTDPRALYHIPECRAWFQSIDRRYPFLI